MHVSGVAYGTRLSFAIMTKELALVPIIGLSRPRQRPAARRRGKRAARRPAGGEWFYTAAVRWRNRRYDRGAAAVHRVGVPVVSVGNLTLGGTGKTPLVRWLARWFHERGVRVAVVSRGYGAKAGQPNDEALELRKSLPRRAAPAKPRSRGRRPERHRAVPVAN